MHEAAFLAAIVTGSLDPFPSYSPCAVLHGAKKDWIPGAEHDVLLLERPYLVA